MALILKGRSKLKGSTVIGKRPYAIDGVYNPELVLDFPKEYYRTNSVSKTFANAITHSATSNATMVDSNGVLKWRPHNLLSYSEQFDNAVWSAINVSKNANVAVAPDGATTADKLSETATTGEFQVRQVGPSLAAFTFNVYAKAAERDKVYLQFVATSNEYVFFDLTNGTVAGSQLTITSNTASRSSSITPVGDGWYLCSITITLNSAAAPSLRVGVSDTIVSSTPSYAGTEGNGVYVWGAHVYRSDLGGMVNNPDQSAGFETYVPTTSSAVYLPRRGHHVYNGSAWVNEGLLHESEARTNSLTYSEDFTNALWDKRDGATVTANQAVSPDGNTTADLIDLSANADARVLNGVNSITSNTVVTASIWLRSVSGTGTYPIGVYTGTSVGTQILVDLTEQWQRFHITFTTADPIPAGQYASMYLGNRRNAAGTPTLLQAYAWGAQLEAAPTPSSYIPTSGATATRAAETLTIPAANLPWPTPEVIGPELVTNGDFSNGTTGWAGLLGAPISVVNGALRVTEDGADGSSARAYQGVATEIGKVYRVRAQLVGASGTNVFIAASTTTNVGGMPQTPPVAATGQFVELVFVAQATTTNIILITQSTSSSTADFDNISVREINPLAVSIQMDGRVTYADEDTNNSYKFFNWYASASNSLYVRINTNSTNVGNVDAVLFSNSVVDIAPSNTDVLAPDVLVPFSTAVRAGSNFLNVGEGGVSYIENTTVTSLPDLSATNLSLGDDYNGTIRTFRMWGQDITNAGLVEATEPSLVPSLSLTFDGTENSFIVEDWSE